HQRRSREQRNKRPGGMSQDIVGSPAIRKHDVLEKLVEIAGVVVKSLHIAAQRVADEPVGSSLAAPVEADSAEAPFLQVAYRFEIFLDTFIAAGQHHHAAFQGPCRGFEAGKAKPLAVPAL